MSVECSLQRQATLPETTKRIPRRRHLEISLAGCQIDSARFQAFRDLAEEQLLVGKISKAMREKTDPASSIEEERRFGAVRTRIEDRMNGKDNTVDSMEYTEATKHASKVFNHYHRIQRRKKNHSKEAYRIEATSHHVFEDLRKNRGKSQKRKPPPRLVNQRRALGLRRPLISAGRPPREFNTTAW